MKKLILCLIVLLAGCAGLQDTAGPPGSPPSGGDRTYNSVTTTGDITVGGDIAVTGDVGGATGTFSGAVTIGATGSISEETNTMTFDDGDGAPITLQTIRTAAGGGGSGTLTTIKENNTGVGGADIVTLDFLGADFDLTEDPDTEIQVVIAAAIARDTELPTAITLHLDDVLTALGIASEAVNFGAFTGTVLPDNSTGKTVLQALGTAVDLNTAKVSYTPAAPGEIGGTTPAAGSFTTLKETAPASLELTGDTSISEAQLQTNKFITNQGSSGEIDLTLPAVSYRISRTFIVEEAQIIELNPPSGELFDLDGTNLDANDCVDSPATVGSKIVATRMKNAAGTWVWSLDTVRGAFVDTGATD